MLVLARLHQDFLSLPVKLGREVAANIAKLPQGVAAEPRASIDPHCRCDLNSGYFAGLRSLTSWASFLLMHCTSSVSNDFTITS